MSCFTQFKYLANNVNRNFVTDFFSSFLQCLIGQVLENKIWLQFVYTKTLIIIHCKPGQGRGKCTNNKTILFDRDRNHNIF